MQIIKKYWGGSNVSVEHLTTFQFKENGRLEAHIAKESASVVALNGPRQVCVTLHGTCSDIIQVIHN